MKAYIGKHVQFTDFAEKADIESFDPGMRAKVVEATLEHADTDDSYWKLVFDFTFWEEYNKGLSRPNWYGKNGEPNVKWHESPFYPKGCIETIYYSPDGKNQLIELLEMGALEEQTSRIVSKVQELIKSEQLKEDFCSTLARQEIISVLS